MESRVAGVDRYGFADQLDCFALIVRLGGDQAGQVQGIGVIGRHGKHLLVERLCLGDLSLSMKGESLFEIRLYLCGGQHFIRSVARLPM